MSIVSRAYTYYRRNGWTRSMKMLGRKVRGNAIPRAIIFAREFETIETRARPKVANPGAKKIKAVSPHAPGITDVEPRMTRGVVAVIGDLNLAQCKKYRVMQKLEVFEQLGLKLNDRLPGSSSKLRVGEWLLAPHRSYLAPLAPLLAEPGLHALAHITGGGLLAGQEVIIEALEANKKQQNTGAQPPRFLR